MLKKHVGGHPDPPSLVREGLMVSVLLLELDLQMG